MLYTRWVMSSIKWHYKSMGMWLVMLLNEGKCILPHGGELCQMALKAINYRVICDKYMDSVKALCWHKQCVHTVPICHQRKRSELHWKPLCIHSKRSLTTTIDALRNVLLDLKADKAAIIKYSVIIVLVVCVEIFKCLYVCKS